MTDPTPEEKFNSDLWSVLQAIKKQILYANNKQRILYPITQGFFGTPYNDDEAALMEKLHNWHIITLEEIDGALSYIGEGERVFIINKIDPRFHQLYRLYENAIQKTISSSHLFQLVQELVTPMGKNTDLSFEVWQLTKKPEDKNKERTLESLTSRKLTNIQVVYNLSADNRSRMKRLIEIIKNQIELTGFKSSMMDKNTLEIPIELIEREKYGVSEAVLLIEKIDETADTHFIKAKSDVGIYVQNGIGKHIEKATKLIVQIESISTLEDIKSHLESFERNIEQSEQSKEEPPAESIKEKISTLTNEKLPVIKYNSTTGLGQVNSNKEFKLRDNKPEYRVFKLLYDGMNKKVLRYDVLVAIHFYEDGEGQDPSRKTPETNAINDIAKKIREKTGLNIKQLVNNTGNLTLIGRNAENTPD